MEQVIPGVRGAAPGAGTATLEWWQQEGKWFSYGGHAIFSRMAGQGDPVVLLHGFPILLCCRFKLSNFALFLDSFIKWRLEE